MTAKTEHAMGVHGGGDLPKPAREGVAWLTARVPSELHDAIKRLADSERRSISTMAVLLLEEALKGRGVQVTQQTDALHSDGGDT